MAYEYQTDQPKRRPIPQVGAVPGTTMEPPNPTGAIGAPRPAYTPPNPTAKGDDMVANKMPDVRRGMPPGQVNGRPGTTPRPAARPLQRGSGFPRPTPPTLPPVEPSRITPMPSIPAVGSPFGPGNDLRFRQVDPQASARTVRAGEATDAAAAQVAGFDPAARTSALADDAQKRLALSDVGFSAVDTDLAAGEAIRPEDSADMAAFRGMRADAARNLASGPSRSEIAMRELDAFDMESSPQIRDQMQAVARKAAALGRTGMGETSFEASQPFVDFLTRRAALESRLAGQTAEGEIQDRQNVLNASRGLVGEEEQIGAGRRGELRGERAYGTAIDESNLGRRIEERNTELGLAERNVGRQYDARRAALEAGMGLAGAEGQYGLSRYGTLAGREADLYGRDASERDELRGERDFQVGTAERATDRALQGYGLEEDARQREFDRQMRLEALRLGQDPTGTMLGVSDRMGRRGEDAIGGAADLFGQFLGGRQGGLNIPSSEELDRIKRGIKIPNIEVAY